MREERGCQKSTRPFFSAPEKESEDAMATRRCLIGAGALHLRYEGKQERERDTCDERLSTVKENDVHLHL